MRARIVAVGVVWALLLGGAAAEAREATPRLGELNRYVLALIETYPTDGTHPYSWPRDGSYDGVTEDIEYQGRVVARGNEAGEAYCCGLTFEVMLKAWRLWCERNRRPFTVGGLSAQELLRLRSDWYCAGDVRTGPVEALVSRGLGVEVERAQDARPGDFVQLWRNNGSGHGVIFLAWERDRRGAITAIRYWSTQRSTNGIGENTERIGNGPGQVDRERIHIARAGRPPARR